MQSLEINPNPNLANTSSHRINMAKEASIPAALPPDPQKYLNEQIRNEKIIQALNSSEGLDQSTHLSNPTTELAEEVQVSKAPKANFLRDQAPIYGYSAASLMHLLAGLAKSWQILPAGLTKFLDQYSLIVSKLVNVANYTYKGMEALAGKRAWEGLARLAYSAIIPFIPLESMFSASGISSGLTMMEQAQRHKLQGLAPAKTWEEDLRRNFSAFKEMVTETLYGLPFISKNPRVFISAAKEKGHTMFLCAWGNFLGALLGFAVGKDHGSQLGKAASLLRNAGGIGCDWAKLIHPDWNNKLSAIFYAGVSAFDFGKSFTNNGRANILSHFSLALNNFANYYYVNTTKTTSDGTFKDYKNNGHSFTLPLNLKPALQGIAA